MLYSLVTGYLLYRCTRPKLEASIPRTVYGWFLGMHRISVVVGLVGYAFLLVEVSPGAH